MTTTLSNTGIVATTGAAASAAASGKPGILEIRAVGKRFGRHRVLHDVSFSVSPGEIVALVGENGAGKSTLVRCIAGTIEPDHGQIVIEPAANGRAGDNVSVVWQDLALCDNLDVVANLFLGREAGTLLLAEPQMHATAQALLTSLDIDIDDLHRPAGQLSGGQRQGVAIARALLGEPRLVIMDEPTSALGVSESARVQRLMRRLRRDGVAILLVSHNLEQVFALADRIVVLRQGEVVGDVATSEVHPDDVVALITGASIDSAARKQLHQLRSLVDQLAEVQPSASLPLIVSALSAALGVDRLCVHLVEGGGAAGARHGAQSGEPRELVCQAAVGLPPTLELLVQDVPLGAAGGLLGVAGARGEPVVVEDLRASHGRFHDAMVAAGVLSGWAIPVVGARGLLGVVSAFTDRVGTPSSAQLELAGLYANLAASAIEREHLLDEVTRRNRILESLRGMLDRLAGPSQTEGDLGLALLPLCIGLGADAVGIFHSADTPPRLVVGIDARGAAPSGSTLADMSAAAESVRTETLRLNARRLGRGSVAVPVTLPEGDGALVARWPERDVMGEDTFDLLDDAARTLGLAIERQAMEEAQKQSLALRRSSVLQREFLMRLSHELRTPLTAIHGFASTLRQTDVRWDEESTGNFLQRIEEESARMSRLVGDLLDSSVIETGGLRLQTDWCDIELVLSQAIALVDRESGGVTLEMVDDLPAVWGDHDRLEQVFVNLIENSLRHGARPVVLRASATARTVTIDVRDAGDGFLDDVVDRAFESYVAHAHSPGAGIGLAIVRGIVDAHGGTVSVVTNQADEYTVVRIVLPIEPDQL
jgi:ABC-type multidrug transport system ATPase subunit/signal transduction histidine kinase